MVINGTIKVADKIKESLDKGERHVYYPVPKGKNANAAVVESMKRACDDIIEKMVAEADEK